MIIPQEVKNRAYTIDPDCWKSYSGKGLRHKQRMESRRTASLALARKELDGDFTHTPTSGDPFNDTDESGTAVEVAVLIRAKQINPACFKSYSGSERVEAQQRAIELARAQIAREAELAAIERESRLLTPEMKEWLIEQMRKAALPMNEVGVEMTKRFVGAPSGIMTAGYGVTTSEEWERGCAARYSVADLDRMRAALNRIPGLRIGSAFSGDLAKAKFRQAAHIESVLRTYMLNGTTPADLEKEADDAWVKIRERRAQREIERERDRQNNAQVQAEISGETPHILAIGLTQNLPLNVHERVALRGRIADAITSVIMKFKK